MSSIAAERHAVRDAIAGGTAVAVHDHLPTQVTPPCIIVVPADPYLGAGETFTDGEVALAFDVWAVAATGDNDFVSDALDGMLEDVLAAAGDAGYGLGDVAAPSTVTVNGSVFLAARVPVSTYATI